MGTNYYCYKKNHERLHIGKKSGGWVFSFRGHDFHDYKIKSFADWKQYILTHDVEVFNEYYEKVENNDFFKMVEDSLKEPKNMMDYYGSEGWSDNCGYSFTYDDFS